MSYFHAMVKKKATITSFLGGIRKVVIQLVTKLTP